VLSELSLHLEDKRKKLKSMQHVVRYFTQSWGYKIIIINRIEHTAYIECSQLVTHTVLTPPTQVLPTLEGCSEEWSMEGNHLWGRAWCGNLLTVCNTRTMLLVSVSTTHWLLVMVL